MLLVALFLAVRIAAQSEAPIPVVGLRTGRDPVTQEWPPRQNILELQASGPAWDLYIQGLAAFKEVSESDELSYFQISGIHGRPFIPWNGVDQAPGAPLTGYCTHDEVLLQFGTGHGLHSLRSGDGCVTDWTNAASLGGHIQEVAAKYQGDQASIYKSAADRWRQPYWDWALDEDLPTIFRQTNMTVNGPNGNITLPNPLLTYKFQQFPLNATLFPSTDVDGLLNTYAETVRCPGPGTNESNQYMASDDVGAYSLPDQLYDIYTRCTTFDCMSSVGTGGTSIEYVHNEIHQAVGGLHPLGHMADLAYSGFDPIFAIHHSSIDRHVALWQAIYYNASMFVDMYATDDGQFSTPPGSNITADSPLLPFYASQNGTFWTGNTARNVAALGYTYPELIGNWTTLDERRYNVTAAVNQLYGGMDAVVGDAVCRRRWNSTESGPHKEYFLEIEIEKSKVSLPATIMVWLNDTSLGFVPLLSSPSRGLVNAEIPVRRTLASLGMNTSDSGSVIRYLNQTLRADVIGLDNAPVSASTLPSFSMTVQVDFVFPPRTEMDFPTYKFNGTWPIDF